MDPMLDPRNDRLSGIICDQCNQATGNNTQGHYWSFCKVTGTVREFHFCCPGDCQLEGS